MIEELNKKLDILELSRIKEILPNANMREHSKIYIEQFETVQLKYQKENRNGYVLILKNT